MIRRSTLRGVRYAVALAFLSWSSASTAQDGIAARYPRDAGIERDPDVIMTEMFERNSVSEVVRGWTNSQNTAGMSLSPDVPAASGGTRSLLMTSVGRTSTGGQLYKKLAPGHYQIFLRYYIKYASVGTYHHTGGWLGGYNPPTDWPQGGAGEKPTGSDRIQIGAEPANAALRFDLYTYWMNMRASPTGEYWGNTFIQNPSLVVRTDRWMCVEVMVKMNDPVSASNGEMALWIDGVQVIHLRPGVPLGRWSSNMFFPDPRGAPFEGFRWRSADSIDLNWIWLLYYTTGNTQGLVGKVWFDHVVVATKYIGPISASAAETIAPSLLSISSCANAEDRADHERRPAHRPGVRDRSRRRRPRGRRAAGGAVESQDSVRGNA